MAGSGGRAQAFGKGGGCAIARGKYQEWLTRDGLTRIGGWARDGLTDEQIAEKIGVHRATLYEWRKAHPDISDTIKKGRAPVDIQVENALLRRATGFECVETVTDYAYSDTEFEADGSPKRIIKNVRETRKYIPPDTGAAAFWLKNRRPDRWRERREEPLRAGSADYSLLDEARKELAEDE